MSRKNDIEFELLHAAMKFIQTNGLTAEFESKLSWCDEACDHEPLGGSRVCPR